LLERVMRDELTIHRNLPAMIATYDETKALILEGFATIKRAREVWNAVFRMGDTLTGAALSVNAGTFTHHEVDGPEGALKSLRAQTWENIVARMGLVNIMSPERFRDLSERIKNDTMGDPTVESVQKFVTNHMMDLDGIFEENVRFVFELLRPRHDRYKRNTQEEIPRSIVLTSRVENTVFGRFKIRSWHRENEEVLALERVFKALDGRGEVARSWKSDLSMAVEALPKGEKHGETDYFKFSCHKNGNLHLTFKRLDLLDKLNKIGGGQRLRKTRSSGHGIVVQEA
jgi:hypothetical protein